MFHDMGFMVGVLQPLYAGIRAVVMSPASFLQRPVRWLEAISHYRATTSGGPNFAYDLCTRKVTVDEAAKLDLSSWSVAFNGAEPVRAETLERFASHFESSGFRPSAFYPCYGLAEATLIVTGGRKESLPVIKEAEAKLMVGCGGVLPDERVIIVDPASLTKLEDGQVGEIWVSGPSVAKGYWNQPQKTEQTFNAYLSNSGEGPFLRTEDLGFIEDGELFITGRIKDVIIIRGLNHYPQDIEWTVERYHAALRPGCGAAFTVEADGEERLVIVHEIDTRKGVDLDQVIETIREAVASEHELQVYAVTLIKPGQISKTSSGKIQRGASRRKFLEGALDVVVEWRATAPEDDEPPELVSWQSSAEAIDSWLVSVLAAKLGVTASSLRTDQPLARYGLDSLTAIELAHSIETSLGVALPMVSFLQAASVAELGVQIHSQLSERSAQPAAARGESENEYPLSYGQRGLWFLHNLAPESTAYNIARAVKIRAALDVAALRRAFSLLVARHASLRTTFTTFARASCSAGRRSRRPLLPGRGRAALERSSTRRALDRRERAPLRSRTRSAPAHQTFTRSSDEHILLLAAHHIIVDFWSLALMMQELGLLYEAEQSGVRAGLPALSSSYSRSSAGKWRCCRVRRVSGTGNTGAIHCRAKLPLLNLPAKRPRPSAQTFTGASEPLHLSPATVRDLKLLSREHRATLYMTLLAAFEVLLHRYSGQEELLVGTVTAGRTRAEFAPLIGYFVNPLVLRATVSGDTGLNRCSTRCAKAYSTRSSIRTIRSPLW
jgi:acyl carrier protein